MCATIVWLKRCASLLVCGAHARGMTRHRVLSSELRCHYRSNTEHDDAPPVFLLSCDSCCTFFCPLLSLFSFSCSFLFWRETLPAHSHSFSPLPPSLRGVCCRHCLRAGLATHDSLRSTSVRRCARRSGNSKQCLSVPPVKGVAQRRQIDS
jgi:hypothetical protein